MYNKLILTLTMVLVVLSASTTAIVTRQTEAGYVEPIENLWIQAEPADWGTTFGVNFHWSAVYQANPDHYLIQQVYYPKFSKPIYKRPYRVAGYTNALFITTGQMHQGERLKFAVAACLAPDHCSDFVAMEYVMKEQNQH